MLFPFPLRFFLPVTLGVLGIISHSARSSATPPAVPNPPALNFLAQASDLSQPSDLGNPTNTRVEGGTYFRMPSPPSTGRPTGRYRGGASRGECPSVSPPLTALVPSTEQQMAQDQEPVTYVWGLTTAARPTFWFYVPYSGNLPATFVLQDADENDVLRQNLSLPSRPGVVGVGMPAATPPLQAGKLYHWYFKVYCDAKKSSSPVFVEGGIQRVALSGTIAQRLKTASPQQKVDLYAASGIWYDALTLLADLRLANPADPSLQSSWAKLLRSVNLGDVVTAPLVK